MALAWTRFGNFFTRRCESGTAAIEFAAIVPFLLIILTGTIELGRAMYEEMAVNNAVEAGALYAAKNGWDAPSIANAVVNAGVVYTGGAPGLTATPAPTQFCGCPNATAGITNSGTCVAPPPCSDGSPAGTYVQINATLPHLTLILPNSGLLPVPAIFTANAVIRIN